MLPDGNDKLYIGGKFNNVAGMVRHGIDRLVELDPTKQVIPFVAHSPAVYSAMGGATVSWDPVLPATSSAGIALSYESATPTVCTVDSSTRVVTTAIPVVSGACTIVANAPFGNQTVAGVT